MGDDRDFWCWAPYRDQSEAGICDERNSHCKRLSRADMDSQLGQLYPKLGAEGGYEYWGALLYEFVTVRRSPTSGLPRLRYVKPPIRSRFSTQYEWWTIRVQGP